VCFSVYRSRRKRLGSSTPQEKVCASPRAREWSLLDFRISSIRPPPQRGRKLRWHMSSVLSDCGKHLGRCRASGLRNRSSLRALARTAIATHSAWCFALESQRNESANKLSFTTSFRWIEMKLSMPRVGEFCPSNVIQLVLSVVIIVTLVTAIGFWLYQSPGLGTSIVQPAHGPDPVK
jgi:hypothetical protein